MRHEWSGKQLLTHRKLSSEPKQLTMPDGVGRYGGEAFPMVLADCDLMATLIKADDLRASVGSKPIVFSRASRNITVGVAVSTDHPAGDIGSLLSQADWSLYAAKQKGRNRSECVDDMRPDVTTAMERPNALE